MKTNLAAWAGTIMNVAAEVQVGKHLSVELPILWCPWHISGKHAVKTFTLQPEARYWLSKPGSGHFFGLHAHVGWFNVKWNRDRYQDADRCWARASAMVICCRSADIGRENLPSVQAMPT